MQFKTKQFNELTPHEIHLLYRLRSQVFVVEQNCVYLDVDEKDLVSHHVLFYNEGEPVNLVGYSRIIPPGISYDEPSIGRVVIEQGSRGKKSGRDLMNYTIAEVNKLFPSQEIVISAQSYLLKFYSGLGFQKEGNEYLEDGIPHVRMRLK